MGVQSIDTQTLLSRLLLLSCRIRLPCVGKVYTRAQAEPGPPRLLPNHLGMRQTNELGQCTLAGRYRSSTHQEDCCLPHGTHTPNDRRMQIEVAEELHAHRHCKLKWSNHCTLIVSKFKQRVFFLRLLNSFGVKTIFFTYSIHL